ncbi:MAG: transglycosylase [Robiginitomaculum sp.]|nr:MAG: transglycosylase [Robiginitomaculum sp.]
MFYCRSITDLIKNAWKTLSGLGLIYLLLMATNSSANIPTPRLKPIVPHTSTLLTKHDANNFRQAIRAADQKKWDNVERYQRRIKDPTAIKILEWRQAVDDPYVSMKLLTKVAQTQSDWPRMTRIRAKAEAHLFDRPLSPQNTINWFQGTAPVSGEGRAALAQAYYKLGENDIADRWLRSAWRDAKLSRDRQRIIYRRYKHRLTPEDHAARADHLIWLGRRYYGSVGGLLSMMNTSDRALMDARMKVGANRRGMDRAIRSVPGTLQYDTGLLFERARWRRIKRTEISALEPLLKITTPARTQNGKDRVWIEKKRMIYWALPKKRYRDAYALTLNHGLTSGANFADAEFLAGWLALTKLNSPKLALEHFTTLKNGVTLPVSVGRASYWMGRAAETMGDQNARAYYVDAARYPNVYYGQLASEHINQGFAFINLPFENIGTSYGIDFENRELVRALRMLGEIQAERSFNQFSFHLDDILEQAHELTLLSQLAKSYGFMKPSVRAAKQAARFDTMLTESGYPKPEIITGLSSDFNIPFVLAIARQESEFNTKARSHAHAHGMMQMINATARATARKARLPYQQAWLTGDPEYAAKLGSHHINDLLVEFDGSYIMAAAAYNAGGGRVRKWNKAYGDPRHGQIDPIDWIESIPFSETRNYVQRVMENMEVYRARLNNNQTQLNLVHNITNGAYR